MKPFGRKVRNVFLKIVIFFIRVSVERYKLLRADVFIILVLVSKGKSVTGNSL